MVKEKKPSGWGLLVDKSCASNIFPLKGKIFDYGSGEMVPDIEGIGADVNFALRDKYLLELKNKEFVDLKFTSDIYRFGNFIYRSFMDIVSGNKFSKIEKKLRE